MVYACENYAFLHTAEEGVYEFTVNGKQEFTDLFTGKKCTFPMQLPKGVSFLFGV